jgi:hypothetical protein
MGKMTQSEVEIKTINFGKRHKMLMMWLSWPEEMLKKSFTDNDSCLITH